MSFLLPDTTRKVDAAKSSHRCSVCRIFGSSNTPFIALPEAGPAPLPMRVFGFHICLCKIPLNFHLKILLSEINIRQ